MREVMRRRLTPRGRRPQRSHELPNGVGDEFADHAPSLNQGMALAGD